MFHLNIQSVSAATAVMTVCLVKFRFLWVSTLWLPTPAQLPPPSLHVANPWSRSQHTEHTTAPWASLAPGAVAVIVHTRTRYTGLKIFAGYQNSWITGISISITNSKPRKLSGIRSRGQSNILQALVQVTLFYNTIGINETFVFNQSK